MIMQQFRIRTSFGRIFAAIWESPHPQPLSHEERGAGEFSLYFPFTEVERIWAKGSKSLSPRERDLG
jgi:hypothetical protein